MRDTLVFCLLWIHPATSGAEVSFHPRLPPGADPPPRLCDPRLAGCTFARGWRHPSSGLGLRGENGAWHLSVHVLGAWLGICAAIRFHRLWRSGVSCFRPRVSISTSFERRALPFVPWRFLRDDICSTQTSSAPHGVSGREPSRCSSRR